MLLYQWLLGAKASFFAVLRNLGSFNLPCHSSSTNCFSNAAVTLLLSNSLTPVGSSESWKNIEAECQEALRFQPSGSNQLAVKIHAAGMGSIISPTLSVVSSDVMKLKVVQVLSNCFWVIKPLVKSLQAGNTVKDTFSYN